MITILQVLNKKMLKLSKTASSSVEKITNTVSQNLYKFQK